MGRVSDNDVCCRDCLHHPASGPLLLNIPDSSLDFRISFCLLELFFYLLLGHLDFPFIIPPLEQIVEKCNYGKYHGDPQYHRYDHVKRIGHRRADAHIHRADYINRVLFQEGIYDDDEHDDFQQVLYEFYHIFQREDFLIPCNGLIRFNLG